MEQKKRSISVYNLETVNEDDITYRVYGETEHHSIGGQGDVEHSWIFFCLDKNEKPVLIEESYDLSCWTSGGPSPDNIGAAALCGITEELLSEEEAKQYYQRFEGVSPRKIALPIELRLQGKPFPDPTPVKPPEPAKPADASKQKTSQTHSKGLKGFLKKIFG